MIIKKKNTFLGNMNPAISGDVKYNFNQITYGLISFIADIEKKLQQIYPKLPVYFMNSGDSSYLFGKKFKECNRSVLEMSTPRFIINFDDIQMLPEQNSMLNNQYVYTFENKIYTCRARRVAITCMVVTDFVTSGLFRGLQAMEIMQTISAYEQVYTYDFCGNTHQAAYVFQAPSMEKPTMDMGANQNMSTKTMFDLQLQLMVPIIDTIDELEDTLVNTHQYGLIAQGVEDYYENITQLFTEDKNNNENE